ncbi:MAG: hypothetical protein JW807_00835 [Spirochaetes bacterium]|nr:hypothetical protein [Spirochaetota bacterium]
MRKRLKSTTISVAPDTGTVRKVKSRTVQAGDKSIITKTEIESVPPVFLGGRPPKNFKHAEKIDGHLDPAMYEFGGYSPGQRNKTNTKRRFWRAFWAGSSGQFSKRAFFFSFFAFISVAYIVFCMIGLLLFDEKLGLFIFGSNAAFGLNYYKNERDKDSNGGPVYGGKPPVI